MMGECGMESKNQILEILELALPPTHMQLAAIRLRHCTEDVTGCRRWRPVQRTVMPDQNVWREAGIFSGILARLQGYGIKFPKTW